jgi:hypothetical protein
MFGVDNSKPGGPAYCDFGAQRLDEMAELRMLGRYKRYYVPAEHGTPILSGRHLVQLRLVNLQYIERPRLLNLDQAATYLGMTPDAVKSKAIQPSSRR